MKIGIMGGTLDPVHNGHVQLARAALDLLGLDRVMLLPAGDPPHKSPPSQKADRMQMVRLAARSAPGLFACGIEIARTGTTYTVDTLRELARVNPHTQWYYLIGADTLDALESWRDFPDVARMCVFAVSARAEGDANRARARDLERRCGARFVLLPFRGPEISSSDIRRRVAEGRSIAGMTPPEVEAYIRGEGLYLCALSKAEVLDILRDTLKPSRYRHTLGVAETARRLAPRFGVDPARAELAGLLHDCAKSMPVEEMRALAAAHVGDVDAAEMETESVLHAPAGCALAALKFGVRDGEILSAIRRHTLGGPGMGAMDALIYTADFIEPNRADFPGLSEARALAERDIFRAMRRCAELTNQYLERQGRRPHPRSLAMLHSDETDIKIKEEEL